MHIPSWILWGLAVVVVLVLVPGLRTAIVRFAWFSARAFALLVGGPFLAFLLVRLVFAHAGVVWAAVTSIALLIVVLPGMYGGLLGLWLFRPRAASAVAVVHPLAPEPAVNLHVHEHHYDVQVNVVAPESARPSARTVKNVTEPQRLANPDH